MAAVAGGVEIVGVVSCLLDVTSVSPPDVLLETCKKLKAFLSGPENTTCFECSSNAVSELSVTLGVTLCIECGQAHREALGSHISFVLPCDANVVENDERAWLNYRGARNLVSFLQIMGNKKGKEYWESHYPPVRRTEENDYHKPGVDSTVEQRKRWLEGKYIKSLFCGMFGREVVVKRKTKVKRMWVVLQGTDVQLFESQKAVQPTEVINLRNGIVRPYMDNAGVIEWLEIQAGKSQCIFFAEERNEIVEWLFSLHRTNCNVLPKKDGVTKLPVSKKSLTKIKFKNTASLDLSLKKQNSRSEDKMVAKDSVDGITVKRRNSAQKTPRSPRSAREGGSGKMKGNERSPREGQGNPPRVRTVTMEDLLLRTTKQEMSHLLQEQEKIASAVKDYEFKRRKLRKKLDACEQTLRALHDEEDFLKKKLVGLEDSLSQWEVAVQKGVHLIEILCKENELSPETEEQGNLLEMVDGEVKCGCLRDLLDILTHPEYCKPSYRAAFLLTYQSFTDPIYLLSKLFERFSMTDEEIFEMIQTETFLQGLPKDEQRKIHLTLCVKSNRNGANNQKPGEAFATRGRTSTISHIDYGSKVGEHQFEPAVKRSVGTSTNLRSTLTDREREDLRKDKSLSPRPPPLPPVPGATSESGIVVRSRSRSPGLTSRSAPSLSDASLVTEKRERRGGSKYAQEKSPQEKSPQKNTPVLPPPIPLSPLESPSADTTPAQTPREVLIQAMPPPIAGAPYNPLVTHSVSIDAVPNRSRKAFESRDGDVDDEKERFTLSSSSSDTNLSGDGDGDLPVNSRSPNPSTSPSSQSSSQSSMYSSPSTSVPDLSQAAKEDPPLQRGLPAKMRSPVKTPQQPPASDFYHPDSVERSDDSCLSTSDASSENSPSTNTLDGDSSPNLRKKKFTRTSSVKAIGRFYKSLGRTNSNSSLASSGENKKLASSGLSNSTTISTGNLPPAPPSLVQSARMPGFDDNTRSRSKSNYMSAVEKGRPSEDKPNYAANAATIGPSSARDDDRMKRRSVFEVLSDVSWDKAEKVDKVRTQIRVRVCNVLRHWVEDHWVDFETHPQLLYHMIRWINDVLTPSGMKSMANSLGKVIMKKFELADQKSDTEINFLFSKKVPTPVKLKGEFEFLDVDPAEYARQVCLLEQRLYKAISLREFLDQQWNKDQKDISAPGIMAFISHFNNFSNLVAKSIVMQLNVKKRTKYLERWIVVAGNTRQYKNFNATMGIISGLQSQPVFRLKKTWAGVDAKYISTYEQLKAVMSQENNWETFRGVLHSEDPPCIPYLGVYLTDLTFLDDSMPNILPNGAINFQKRTKLATVIGEIHQYRQEPYPFIELANIQEGIQKQVKSPMAERDLFNLSVTIEPKQG